MVIFPNAKINLGLRVIEKRSDNYHNIETIYYPVCLCDALEFVIPENQLEDDIMTITGISINDINENLVIKAVKLLRKSYMLPYLNIYLHKVIPIGAGLGGGSSDASFMLKALNKYFELNLECSDLKSLAKQLGSDCPFFIDNSPAFAYYRGDIMKPCEPVLSGYYIVILNPSIHINTAEAYNNIKPECQSENITELIKSPIADWKNFIKNDFETYVFKRNPIISNIKNSLYDNGAVFSLMSGSGSSVYGIFSNKPDTAKWKFNNYIIFEGTL